MFRLTKTRGFTLIELLVVIAIIGVLSSVVLASVNSARTKGSDARVKADFSSIQLALQLYYDKNGAFPGNKTNCCTYPSTNADFLSELVTDGDIPSVPRPPNSNYLYLYYNYGGSYGAMLGTTLLASPPSTAGLPGTCRPFPAGFGFCDQSSNTYYCLCNF